jgi:ABC-2 type transport system permease protein
MLDLYRTHYKIYVAWALQYRFVLALWAIAGVTETFVSLAVWRAVAAASGGTVGSYDQTQFVAYFVIVMLVSELTHGWVFWTWEWRVNEGSFSSRLLQPAHPLHADVVDNIAVKSVSMLIKVPIAFAIANAFGASFTHDWVHLVALVPVLVGAYALRMLIEAVIACMAFWLTRMAALANAYYMVWAFTSGQFAPVELLPGVLGDVAQMLPFQWALGFPVELALGRLTYGEIAVGLAHQAAWILATYATFRLLWRAASRRYTAVGS